MDLKIINRAIEQLSEERGIAKETILAAIEAAVAAAYKKEFCKRSEIVKTVFNSKTAEMKFFKVKVAVDETTVRFPKEGGDEEETAAAPATAEEELPLYNPDRHILIEEARAIKPDVKVGEELEFPLEAHENFGRIAAQSAKQVILSKIREAEKDSILKEFRGKDGEIVSGIIQRVDRGNVFIDLGRTTGVMFFNETIPGEYYRVGDRMRFYLLAVQDDPKAPGLIFSRSHPKFVSKLFEMEVPEIQDKSIEIKAIAREPGYRTKIAVASTVEGVDPIGALVGQRGTRVTAVTNELGNERIDIIEWHDTPAKFIAAALSPAKAKGVEILEKHSAKVFMPDDQVSLAIGKAGQNVRLAAKLTGWKIDVRAASKPDEVLQAGVAEAIEQSAAAEEKSESVEKEKGEE